MVYLYYQYRKILKLTLLKKQRNVMYLELKYNICYIHNTTESYKNKYFLTTIYVLYYFRWT